MPISQPPHSQSAITVDKHGRFIPVSETQNTANTVSTAGTIANPPQEIVNPQPEPASPSLVSTIETDALGALGALPGLITTGEAAAASVAAQGSVIGKIEAALESVFNFVPPLVAAADPEAAALVTGIGAGLRTILSAVSTHAQATTAKGAAG